MFNSSTARDLETAKKLKGVYFGVVETLVALIEHGDGKGPPPFVKHWYGGREVRWERATELGSRCPECGCDRIRYEPDGYAVPFDFCLACWLLDGEDPTAEATFHVGLSLQKQVRDLPPGVNMSKTIGEVKLDLTPRREALTPEEEAQALLDYRTQARSPLEIGRQVWLGRMHFNAWNGVPRDYGEVRRWFEMAAKWGHGEALAALGFLALRGLGEPKDPIKASGLFRQGAERGFGQAQFALGRMYWDGEGIPRDRVAAVAWWQLAVKGNDQEAKRWLGHALIDGEGTEPNIEAGLALLREVAESGNADVQYELGRMLAFGKRVPPDKTEASKWLRLAAEAGNAEAQTRLAQLLREGLAPNHEEARDWLSKAAAQGHPTAQNNLAGMFRDGLGGDSDIPGAVGLFEEAIRQGFGVAAWNLGLMYDEGKVGRQDLARAAELYRIAANAGDPDAWSRLAEMYETGEGVPRDLVEACLCWWKASSVLSPPEEPGENYWRVLATLDEPAKAKVEQGAKAWTCRLQ